jgi:hypothetical protein
MCARLVFLLVAFTCSSIAAGDAQTPETPPASGFILLDERKVDRFLVQRWVSQASREVSPSEVCECMTVVYEGKRQVLRLGLDQGITRVESSGRDITGDGLSELVVTTHSGGAHCCESTAIYSVGGASRKVLSVSTGNCPGELVDLNNDGVPEFKTCDDTFANTICSLAFSPMPTVVFAYDKTKGAYAVATPRYLNAADEAAPLPDGKADQLQAVELTVGEMQLGIREFAGSAASRSSRCVVHEYVRRRDRVFAPYRRRHSSLDDKWAVPDHRLK